MVPDTFIWDPKDPKSVNGSIGYNTCVIDGAFTLCPSEFKEFLEQKRISEISVEDASKLNTSEWIWYENKFWMIIPLKERYIEKIFIKEELLELKGELENFQDGNFFSRIIIIITVNDSAIISDYPNGALFGNLNFTYNGESHEIEYNYQNKNYIFEKSLVFSDNFRLYPFDKNSIHIDVTGGELINRKQEFNSAEAGFKLLAVFNKSKITITKQRDVFERYILSIVLLFIFSILLYNHFRNLDKNDFSPKKLLEISSIIYSIIFFGLIYLAYPNLNIILSIGTLPFLIIILFFIVLIICKKEIINLPICRKFNHWTLISLFIIILITILSIPLIERNPKENAGAYDKESLNLEGVKLIQSGDLKGSIKLFDKALKIDPNFTIALHNKAGALNNKGIELANSGKYRESIDLFDKALKIDQVSIHALFNKALAFTKLERYKESLIVYNKTVNLYPNYKEAWDGMGVVLVELKRYNESIETYKKALEIDPNFKEALHDYAIALTKLKLFEESLEYFDKVLEIYPDYKEAWSNRGTALYFLKRYNESIESYNEALKIDPNYKEAIINKERVIRKLNNLGIKLMIDKPI